VENLQKFVELSGARVLEVGAGTGRDTDHIAAMGAEAHALDYSEESLALMRASIRHPVKIVCGDALRLPFASETFDVVYHQGLLEHFRDPGALIDENVRVLKKGGVLLIDVPQRYHYYTVLKHILIFFGRWFAGWETEFSPSELEGMIQQRGMRIVGMYGHNMSPPIWYRGLRRIVLGMGIRLPMYPRQSSLMASWKGWLRRHIPEKVHLNTAMVVGCVAVRD